MRREWPDTMARAASLTDTRRWRDTVVALALFVIVAAACSGDDDADDHDIPGVYVAVIRSVAPGTTGVMPNLVYIEPLPGTKLSLEDQAAVVKTFGDATTVRFVDDRTEAVEVDQPQARVRRDGVLLRMAPAQTSGDGLSVKTTRYVARYDERTACLDLHEVDHTWTVTSTREC